MRSLRLIAALVIPAQFALAQQSPGTAAGQGKPLTLDEAIATAHQNNPAFLQIQNGVRTAETTVRQTLAALLPSSSASFTTRYQQGGTQFFQGAALSSGSADSRQSSYSLGLNYNISPSIAFAPRSAHATKVAAEADVTSQAEALRAQVTTQYITALQARAQASLQDTLVQTAQGQLDLANAKMEVGAGTILDVRTAEVAVGQARVNALTAHNTAVVEKLRLFQLMGVPADTGAVLSTDFNVSQPPFTLDSVLEMARHVNPDVAAKKSREYAADMNVHSARTLYLPTLSIGTGWGGNSFEYVNSDIPVLQAQQNVIGRYNSCIAQDSIRTRVGLAPLPTGAGTNCGTGVFTDQDIATARASNNQFPFKFNRNPIGISATLSLPIFNGYQREAQIEQAKIARDNAAYDLRSRSLQLTTDVTQAYLNLVTAARTVELNAQIAQKSAEELAFAEESYKVGAKTFLDVTTARGTYETAQINRVDAVYNYHKAFAALENAVGRPLR